MFSATAAKSRGCFAVADETSTTSATPATTSAFRTASPYYAHYVEALLAFAAALLALRLSGRILARWRARRSPELTAWGASLVAYAVASAALAWRSAHGWAGRAFRVYSLFG